MILSSLYKQKGSIWTHYIGPIPLVATILESEQISLGHGRAHLGIYVNTYSGNWEPK